MELRSAQTCYQCGACAKPEYAECGGVWKQYGTCTFGHKCLMQGIKKDFGWIDTRTLIDNAGICVKSKTAELVKKMADKTGNIKTTLHGAVAKNGTRIVKKCSGY